MAHMFVPCLRFALGVALAASAAIAAPPGASDDAVKSLAEDLRLERLFPKKSAFGPSASAPAFSRDGRYASWLYRPYDERRHGRDLYVLDLESGDTTRVTSVSVLAPYSSDARAVRDHRIERWKKKHGGQTAAGDDPLVGSWTGRLDDEGDAFPPEGLESTLEIERDEEGTISGRLVTALNQATIHDATFDAESGRLELRLHDANAGLDGRLEASIDGDRLEGSLRVDSMDWTFAVEMERGERELDGDEVLEDDADDEKGPRYSGVSSYVWSPTAPELLFSADGDLYRFRAEEGNLERLTHTRERERAARYTPDGLGYLYMRDGALMRVTFDSDRLEQIDPGLDGGWTMSSYRLSPDGKRLAIVATKGTNYFSTGQRVKIVNYRDRFAEVREVNRHMSDDERPDYWWSVWLHEIDDQLQEEGALRKVHEHKQSGPRDAVSVPAWAPDSSRVTFATYEQSTGHASIYEARFLADAEGDGAEKADAPKREDTDEDSIEDARLVYRLLHHGGPTTPPMVDPEYLWDSRHIVFLAELSGYRQLHVLDPLDELLEQLTRGRFEVYPAAISEDHRTMFATSTKGDPTQQHVFVIDLESGEMERLSGRPGFYSSIAVSEDGTRALASHVDFDSPRELVLLGGDDDLRVLTDSHPPEAHALTEPVPEYFTYENRHGQSIHGHMFKPDDWSPDDARPLLIYVYGGPLGTRKMATRGSFSAPSYHFAYYMAKKHGYVTCTIDPRGVSGYGGLFEKSNFEQVGRPQVEDLVDGAKWFIANHGVDADRVGIHGWSFGGFQTQMCLYTEPDVFAVGIAGAGPTEWENYNSWYSTGTIGPSREGHTDLEEFSLLPLAKNLKGHLLLVHGMEDSNVLYQDTVRVYRELLKADKEALVDLFLDPTGGHGLGGDVKTVNRYRKYEAYLTQHLGEGSPASAPDPESEED